jgi:hypothetical protein
MKTLRNIGRAVWFAAKVYLVEELLGFWGLWFFCPDPPEFED